MHRRANVLFLSALMVLAIFAGLNTAWSQEDILEALDKNFTQFFDAQSNGELQISETNNVRLFEEISLHSGFERNLSQLRGDQSRLSESLPLVSQLFEKPASGSLWFFDDPTEWRSPSPESGIILFPSRSPIRNSNLPRHWFAIRYFSVEGERKIVSIRRYLDAPTAIAITAATLGLPTKNHGAGDVGFTIPYETTREKGMLYLFLSPQSIYRAAYVVHADNNRYVKIHPNFISAMSGAIEILERIRKSDPEGAESIERLLDRLPLHDFVGVEPFALVLEHYVVQEFIGKLLWFTEMEGNPIQDWLLDRAALESVEARLIASLDPTCIFCTNRSLQEKKIPSSRLYNLTDRAIPEDLVAFRDKLSEFIKEFIYERQAVLENRHEWTFEFIEKLTKGKEKPLDKNQIRSAISKEKERLGLDSSHNSQIRSNLNRTQTRDHLEALLDLHDLTEMTLEFSVLAQVDRAAMGYGEPRIHPAWLTASGQYTLQRKLSNSPRQRILDAQARLIYSGRRVPVTVYPPRR